MPEIIITPRELEEHKIEKYSFRKVDSKGAITLEGDVDVTNQAKPFALKTMDLDSPPKTQEEIDVSNEEIDIQEVPSLDSSTNPEGVEIEKFSPPSVEQMEENKKRDEDFERLSSQNEELLKKVDELSSQVIKVEMELEKKEEEFTESLEEVKEQSFNEGVEEGSKKATQESDNKLSSVLAQLENSIKKLDENAFLYENGLSSLENELTTVALDIAKEVIAKEITIDSSIVASSLASTLLKEVKDASEITIRLSPADSDTLKQTYQHNKKIKIESDEAVTPGGVIILSDIGNINGDIHTRYEQLKKHSLENE